MGLKTFPFLLFTLVLALYCHVITEQCQISGQQIGTCQQKKALSLDSFCYNYVDANICLPQDRSTWSQYNQAYRDELIEDIFMKNLEKQLVQEYQDPWSSNIVSNNLECYYAYRAFICRWNIPQCDPITLKTKAPCRSYCVSFFTNCAGNTQICDVVYGSKDIGLDSTC